MGRMKNLRILSVEAWSVEIGRNEKKRSKGKRIEI
jgi:hypothetical protein